MATSATHLLTRFSYPKQPGDQPWSIIDVTGPTSYQQMLPNPPLSGGQLITAADFGLQSLDFVTAMGAVPPYNGAIYVPRVFPDGFALGGSFDAVRLMWSFALSTGQPAATSDLSMFTVRLLAIGR